MPPLLHAGRSGGGRRVVLVHGFTQSAASWAPVSAELADRFEVLAVDLPGHGRSLVPGPDWDLWRSAEALGATGGRAAYLGYSLGGRVCLHLALDSPELVERLVVVGAHPGIAQTPEREARRRADESLARRLEEGGDAGLPAFVDEWLAGPLFAHLSAEQAGREARLVNGAAGLAASLRSNGTGSQEPLWDRLGELAMPVLVVAGERDDKFAAIAMQTVEAIGANASLRLVSGAGHAACFEQPAAFAAVVSEFLAESH